MRKIFLRQDNIIPSLILILFSSSSGHERDTRSELYDSRETKGDTPSSFKDFV